MKEFGPTHNTWFLEHSRVHYPNGISIGLAVFAQLMVVSNRHTHTEKHADTDHGTSVLVTVGRIFSLCACEAA